MKVIDTNNGIKVVINDTYTISKGETLVETRDNFLDMMGRVFDEAIYDSLSATGEAVRDLPNTVALEMIKDGSLDTLKELSEYVQNNPYLWSVK